MSEVCTWCGVEWGATNMRCINGRLHHTPAASVADTCKCGHSKTLHGPFECDKCNCTAYTPAAAPEQAAPAWLERPDDAGWWICCEPSGYMEPTLAHRASDGTIQAYRGITWDGCQYARMTFPPKPAPPLPKSRTVTLTANVTMPEVHDAAWPWRAEVVAVNAKIGDVQFRHTKQAAVQWVRDTYGIEPEVSEA